LSDELEQDTGNGQSWEDSLDSTLEEITGGRPIDDAPAAEDAPEPGARPGPARDASGRFAPKQEAAPAAETDLAVAPAAEPVEANQANQAAWKPASWKPEELKEWESVPPSARAAIERREREMQRGFEAVSARAQAVQQFEQAIQPFVPVLQQTGVHPVAAVREALQFVSTLNAGNPTQRAEAIGRLAQRYGVQIGVDAQQQFQPGDPNSATHAELMELRNRLQAFEYHAEQRQLQEQQYQTQAMLSSIDTFKADKPDFEVLRPLIAYKLSNGLADSLDSAYAQARADLQGHFDSQRSADAAKRVAEARKAASPNVTTRGAPVPAPSKPKNWQDGLDQVAASLFANQ